jgi:ABC-type microcin C transport system permease subunit YejE
MPSIAHLGQAPPNAPDAARGHYLGTDAQGRDVASRLLYGFRISIFFALFLVLTGQVIGTFIGSQRGQLTITEQQAYARTRIEQLEEIVESVEETEVSASS